MNIPANQASFTRYPVNHVLGILGSDVDVQRLAEALEELGIPPLAIKLFHGSEGVRRFTNGIEGPKGWFQEFTEILTGTGQDRHAYMNALQAEERVVAVDLHEHLDQRTVVGQAFKTAGAWDVNFLGSGVIDPLD